MFGPYASLYVNVPSPLFNSVNTADCAYVKLFANKDVLGDVIGLFESIIT